MEALQRLADNLNYKYETAFLLRGNNSRLINSYNGFDLDPNREYKIGLKYFSVYNSLRNVTESNNKFRYSKDGGVTWIDLTFAPGSYEASFFNKKINDIEADDTYNISFVADLSTNKFELQLKNNRQVDFSIDNSIRTLLGFNSGTYTTSTIAQNKANIENGIGALNIHCNIARGMYLNNKQTDIIFSIPAFTTPLAHRIVQEPSKIMYFPLKTKSITDLIVQIKDDKERLVDFGGEQVMVLLHLKQI